MTYWILFIGIAILSYLVQANLKRKFDKYSRMALSNGMTGREIAEKMLRDNGIYDVRVTSTPGMLTDHYNPANKTVNLSEGVYNTCSIAAAAVAAHECGHTFPQLMLIGICLFAMTTLFSFITLPVEIDASRRALVWLRGAGVTNNYNQSQAFDALKSAAYTYVVAALGSLATLVYYILIFTNRRE